MPVVVRCAQCGAGHPSRVRARSGGDFGRFNPHLGAVLEHCPGCGSSGFQGSADREWRDAPPRTSYREPSPARQRAIA